MPGNQNYPNQWWSQTQYPNYAQGTPTTMPVYSQMVNPYGGSYTPYIQSAPSYEQSGGLSGVAWVQGEAGASAYPVAKGSSMLLMDANPGSNQFWIKSSDPYSGRPLPLEKYRYEKIQNGSDKPMQISTAASPETIEYVPKNDFDALKSEIASLKQMLEDLTK